MGLGYPEEVVPMKPGSVGSVHREKKSILRWSSQSRGISATDPHFVHSALSSRAPKDASEATDRAAVNSCVDAIAARSRTWNIRDTVGHETIWERNGAHMGSRKAGVWSATLAPTAR